MDKIKSAYTLIGLVSVVMIGAGLAGSVPEQAKAAGTQMLCDYLPSGSGFSLTCQNAAIEVPAVKASATPAASVTATDTLTAAPATATGLPPETETATASPSATELPSATVTVAVPSATVPPSGNVQPFRDAPLCAEHSNSEYHALWNSALGCHYDHEHGADPFTSAVAAAFPGFDLLALLGGVGIGHTNPSSPAENTSKHGGFKWQVTLDIANVCNEVFEGGTIATKKAVIQFHAFGRQDVEHEARTHSSVAMFEFCKIGGDPNDVGYMYVGQLQEYGQRVMPYQGMVMDYPDNFQPEYISPRGPYLTTECFGPSFTWTDADGTVRNVGCRATFNSTLNNLTIWTSKPTGSGPRPETSKLFRLLFRGRDNYQRVDGVDARNNPHPFDWRFVCSSDGGVTFNPAGCRHNSSSMTVHEVAGDIPAAWDNLAGFDSDPRVGRITAQGFVTRYGDLNPSCTEAGGLDCQPLRLINAFVGRYSSELTPNKVSNPGPLDTPERDMYFCGASVCGETSPGAAPSGWIESEN